MANKNLLSYGGKVAVVEQVYYAPVVVVPADIYHPIGSNYVLLAKPDPWTDDNNPPTPTQDQLAVKSFLKNVFAAKLVTSANISPVIQRINWTTGTVYDYYKDTVNMFGTDANGKLLLNFYVKNKYDQVFKCLWNKNGAVSTNEPFFEPGSYNTNNLYQGPDGYKWKYMYTIGSGLKTGFMDTEWMPVVVGYNTPNEFDSNGSGAGSIDVINVINGGSGYDPANAAISLSVDGDGSSLVTSINVSGGSISDIIVTTPGKNYSYANVTIVSSLGANAVLVSPTSPIGGHGYDSLSELGCTRVMYSVEFAGSESGYIPTDITYHQLGLVINPSDKANSPYPATEALYDATTQFVVAAGFGDYVSDERVYQGSTYETSTFSATVLSFDVGTNVLKLINTKGTPVTSSPVFGVSSGTTRTLLSYNPPSFIALSGYLALIENRSGIQRSADGIEQFKFVLGY